MTESQVPQTNENDTMSIINNINLNQVTQQLQTIKKFQAVVQQTLQKDQDYGVIAGTGKPTLLKPGAEKLLMILGMTSEYEIIEKIVDYDKGFFSYTVKSQLFKGGKLITEGFGSANTREERYRKNQYDEHGSKSWDGKTYQDPYTLNNTVLKMAKKRAQIDATLTVSSLSNVFTQDLEDMQGLARKEENETMTLDEAANRKLSFGKHSGRTFGEIFKEDQGYLRWLKDNARKAADKQAATMVLKAAKASSSKHAHKAPAAAKPVNSHAAVQSKPASQKPAPQSAAKATDPFADSAKSVDISDDDLPF